MRLLLDTNALLWALANAPRIESVRELLLAEDNDVFVSTVSWWEIAIKSHIGKLNANLTELRAAALQSGFLELPLLGAHAEMLAELPRHHNDPFDHMLVAQAMTEPMRLITGDAVLSRYSPLVLRI
ncbi:type II toxin-antitoxin system VapC family toxin [Desulfovibrio sp.]|uniref:type II toxin-antitoxin system VapC family toxin n=1 Tax=Desulfovibrio sp. TaxID=885 RepID=UPI0025BB8ADA|nr:type II toxin-antitoxin system VapC family toxin [Desulfovibrio sp.]